MMMPLLALQTRLPGELASELESIATEYEADLMYYQQVCALIAQAEDGLLSMLCAAEIGKNASVI